MDMAFPMHNSIGAILRGQPSPTRRESEVVSGHLQTSFKCRLGSHPVIPSGTAIQLHTAFGCTGAILTFEPS